MIDIESSGFHERGAHESALMTAEHAMNVARFGIRSAKLSFPVFPRNDHISVKNVPSLRHSRISQLSQHVLIRERISAVHEIDPLAFRFPYPLVHGIVDSPVGFGDQPVDPIPVTSDHVQRSVRGAPVDHDVFVVGKLLEKNASNRSLHFFHIVQHDGYDGKQWGPCIHYPLLILVSFPYIIHSTICSRRYLSVPDYRSRLPSGKRKKPAL